MLTFVDDLRKARRERAERRRAKRSPLIVQAAACARHPVVRAVPVHSRNPAIETALGAAEIVAFVALVVTPSAPALVVFLVAAAGFLVVHLSDRRAVLAMESERRGSVLASGRNGRPVAVIGPADLDAPLPTTPRGLSTPIQVTGRRWWVDRSSYQALRPSATPPG